MYLQCIIIICNCTYIHVILIKASVRIITGNIVHMGVVERLIKHETTPSDNISCNARQIPEILMVSCNISHNAHARYFN